MNDTRLIERCRQGDTDALEELYKAYAQRMRGVCRHYVSDEQTVDDVLHDAFVIIFTSFDKLRDVRCAEAWMTAITRNVASKCKDRLMALPTVPLDETNEATLDPWSLTTNETQETSVAESEEQFVRDIPLSEVVKMIDRLPKGYGQVFRLSVFDGLSHKEIAAMLGIEPHSSSSQLARAKKMLRKMMQQYWAAMLLLLLPIGVALVRYIGEQTDEEPLMGDSSKVVATTDSVASAGSDEPMVIELEQRHSSEGRSVAKPSIQHSKSLSSSDRTPPPPQAAVPDGSPSGLPKHIAQHDSTAEKPSPLGNQGYAQRTPEGTPTAKDSTLKENPIPNLNYSFPNSHDKKWSFELAYAGQLDEQHRYNRPFSFRTVASDDQSQPAPTLIVPSSIDNWSDYAAYLANNPDVVTAQTRSVVMRIALNNANRSGEDKILRTSHHQMPVTWSLALKYRLTNHFGIESGLSYSRLSSDFEMGADGNTIHEQQTIHYLGIPMKGIYNMYAGKRWSLYGSLGLTTEIPVRSTLHSNYYVYGQYELSEKTTLHAPWQFSTTVGIGLQYHLTPSIGLFAEPSLQYFIPTQSDIETYRTEHPRTLSLPLGVRITW